MRSYLIISMCLLYLIQFFIPIPPLQYGVVSLALFAFIGSAPKADRIPSLLGIAMLSAGMVIEWNKGSGLTGIYEGISLTLPLLTLITLAPLLSLPFRIGGYFHSVSLLLNRLLHKPKTLYAGITGILFLLSPILNLGTVRIMNDFLAELKLPSAVSAKSYIVGFMTSMLWSPYFASVSLVLYYMNVTHKEYVIYGIGLSIVSLLVGNLYFALWEKRHPLATGDTAMMEVDKQSFKPLGQLLLFVILLMSTCIFLEDLTNWPMLVIVSLIACLFPFLYILVTSTWKHALPLLRDYRERTVSMISNEFMLFMSAGMFAYALEGTQLMNRVSDFLSTIANQSFFLFIIALLTIVFIFTAIGIHPIAIIGALAMQLNPAELGMSEIALALTLLVAWATSSALSPFSGLNIMVSHLVRLPAIQVGLRMNGLYLLTVVFIGMAVVSLIRFI